jgi:hypothetical protein
MLDGAPSIAQPLLKMFGDSPRDLRFGESAQAQTKGWEAMPGSPPMDSLAVLHDLGTRKYLHHFSLGASRANQNLVNAAASAINKKSGAIVWSGSLFP